MARVRRGNPTRHHFAHDGDEPDARGVRWCATCNLAETNAIHEMPETTEEQREHEARRVGER